LKHIKSQVVSLQAFAPDVSSETAYVINRTLLKDPDKRYQSYAELIEHLSYARAKLLERAANPRKPKERVVVESEEQQTLMGLITMGVVLVFVVAGILLYIYRGPVFGISKSAPAAAVVKPAEINQKLARGKAFLFNKKPEEALEEFRALAETPGIAQPTLNWVRLNTALAALAANQGNIARQMFELIQTGGLYSSETDEAPVAGFFLEVSRHMAKPQPISESILPIYAANNYEAFGLLFFGIKDFTLGEFETAQTILQAFMASTPEAPYDWINDYKPFAQHYLDDIAAYVKISSQMESATEAAAASKLLGEAKAAQANLQTTGKIKEKFETLIQEISAHAVSP
ncbi:MAG: hypothetical protein ABI615_04475, partial [Chthoniobacterales bacterium]